MLERYQFVNSRLKILVGVIDAIGGVVVKLMPHKVLSRTEPYKILIISLDLMGDNVFATPLPRILKENYPDGKISILVNSNFADVFSGNPFVDELIPFDTPWFPRKNRRTSLFELRRLSNEIAKRKFDLGIDPRGDLRHNLIMYWAGIPVRVGYGVAGGGFLLTHEAQYPWRAHRVEKNLAVLKPLGIDGGDRSPEVFASEGAWKKVAEALGLAGSPHVIGIHPSASCQAKRWPVERFAEVADYCASGLEAKVVVTGSSGDKEIVSRMVSMMKNEPEIFVGRSLDDLIALLSGLDLFIAGDTGPLHVAIAVGTTAIAVYGGENNPAIWGPYGGNHILIRKEVPCGLCGKTDCSNHICLDSISASEVIEAVKSLIGEKAVGSAT